MENKQNQVKESINFSRLLSLPNQTSNKQLPAQQFLHFSHSLPNQTTVQKLPAKTLRPIKQLSRNCRQRLSARCALSNRTLGRRLQPPRKTPQISFSLPEQRLEIAGKDSQAGVPSPTELRVDVCSLHEKNHTNLIVTSGTKARSRNMIAIATATSGVAASILPGGRTAHSRFKIPINGNDSSVCNISKQSGTVELLRRAKIIIWDEAPMAKRWEIEAVDRSLRDIMNNNILFGGKTIVFGGDFRQVLPVVPRATRAETINASLVRSYIWSQLEKLKLTTNMRALSDSSFSEFLLRVGNGDEQTINEDMVQIPNEMLIQTEDVDNAESCLISTVFPSLQENSYSTDYITQRAILATKNESVDMLNEKLITMFPGYVWTYYSYDEAIDDTHNYYPEEFLNTLTPNGLPPYKLVLKINSPIMLLRNVDPSEGLCNGTRMVCRGFDRDVIHAEVTLGQFAGKSVFLPRIPLLPTENEYNPFQFKRTQFPVRLCFAMTINKAQGQTIPHVGLYLPQNVFSHGQLYVALSRGTSMSTTKVLVKTGADQKGDKTYTKNVVFKEVLTA